VKSLHDVTTQKNNIVAFSSPLLVYNSQLLKCICSARLRFILLCYFSSFVSEDVISYVFSIQDGFLTNTATLYGYDDLTLSTMYTVAKLAVCQG
jgi:hypothetical protein